MKKDRKPIYFAASGCGLGIIIMIAFVAITSILGQNLMPISGSTFQTIINFGSWLLPLGLGVLGYFWAKNRQGN